MSLRKTSTHNRRHRGRSHGNCATSPVYAHGFGERYDLPLPLNMFMIAAAAAVAASFVVIGLFVNKQPGEFRYPTLNLLAVPVLGAVLRSKVFTCAFKLIGVAVFLLLIATSLFGVNKPVENLLPYLRLDHLVGRHGLHFAPCSATSGCS